MAKRIRVGEHGEEHISQAIEVLPFKEVPTGKAFITYPDEMEAIIYVKYIDPSWGKCIYSEDSRQEIGNYKHFDPENLVIMV